MSKLRKSIKAMHKADNNPVTALPVYGAGGYTPSKKKSLSVKPFLFLGAVILVLLVIYLPEVFYTRAQPENNLVLPADFTAIKKVSEYTRDCPEMDFDGDGLLNYLEQQHGTSPRRIDTDGDGVSDYAEIYLTKSNPSVFDKGLMEKQVQSILDKAGVSYTDPYKIDGVVLWAENLTARAFGGVVRTVNGYRFCGFTGWAEFPVECCAYAVSGDGYRLLEYRADSNAWKIDGDCTVYLSSEPLSFTHQFKFISWSWQLPDNVFTRCLSAILPDHAGFLTCLPKAHLPEAKEDVKAKTIQTPKYDPEDYSRFGSNHNKLSDLSEVYALLDSGSCVLASLNSADFGECLALIYGYTSDGHLLIADPETGVPAGNIYIVPAAAPVLMADGTIEQQTFFDFFGMGFDSSNADRIHFVAASAAQ